MVGQVNNFAHGHSGVRLAVIEQLLALLEAGCTPIMPTQGSVGYLSHTAHIGLALIGEGQVRLGGDVLPAPEALRRCGRVRPLAVDLASAKALLTAEEP